jgi:hypothetical protein
MDSKQANEVKKILTREIAEKILRKNINKEIKEIDFLEFDEIAENAFSNMPNLVSIEIPNNIKKIGAEAFS